jgi:hypothetical protein
MSDHRQCMLGVRVLFGPAAAGWTFKPRGTMLTPHRTRGAGLTVVPIRIARLEHCCLRSCYLRHRIRKPFIEVLVARAVASL